MKWSKLMIQTLREDPGDAEIFSLTLARLVQLLAGAGREEQAMMTTLAGIVVVLMMLIQEIHTLFETVKTVFGL